MKMAAAVAAIERESTRMVWDLNGRTWYNGPWSRNSGTKREAGQEPRLLYRHLPAKDRNLHYRYDHSPPHDTPDLRPESLPIMTWSSTSNLGSLAMRLRVVACSLATSGNLVHSVHRIMCHPGGLARGKRSCKGTFGSACRVQMAR